MYIQNKIEYFSSYYSPFKEYFTVEKLYFIPDDKKGKIIPNTNLMILNKNDPNLSIFIDNNHIFSIQLFASPDYESVLNMYNNYMNNFFYNKNDFLIVGYKYDNWINYLLLYKNFPSMNDAKIFCYNLKR